jgi:uncharacterized BrkB/YihY/UPF0761 family membrane protein
VPYFDTVTTTTLKADEEVFMNAHQVQQQSNGPPPTGPPAPSTKGDREARLSILLVVPGLVVAMIVGTIWQLSVGVASMGGDESDLTRGWEGVLRSLPSYLLYIGVAVTAFVFAMRARRHGAHNARVATVVSSLALLFVLNSVTRDSAEIVMETRAATVSWMLFGVDVVIVGLALLLGTRWAKRSE